MPLPVLPTSLVGSYAQPEWLIDRAKLAGRFPPRVRAKELWRVEPALLGQAQDDATQLAIRAQERAGLDLLTDGEIRRESYSNHFATALETTRGRRWTAPGTPTRCPASSARSTGRTRCRPATWSSCAATRTGR